MKRILRGVFAGAWLSIAAGGPVCAQESEVLTGGEAVRDTGGAAPSEGDGIFIELVDPFEVGFDGGEIADTEEPPEPDPCGFEFQRGFAFPGGFTIGNGSQSITILDLEVFDDGSGPQLAIGGKYLVLGGTPGSSVQLWDGVEYLALASARNPRSLFTTSVVEFSYGFEAALYASSEQAVVGIPRVGFASFARWDGVEWSVEFAVGGPFERGIRPAGPSVMRVGNLGNGDQLYCARDDAGGIAVARYDGFAWDVLADDDTILIAREFKDMIVFDDGMGLALYLAGSVLRLSSDQPIVQLLRYRDGDWSSAGLEMDGTIISALEVFDDGNGAALYAGGDVGIFRLRNGQWTSILDLSASEDEEVGDLCVWDDGAGPALFVAGRFPDPDALGRYGVLGRWIPGQWRVLGSHVESLVVDQPRGLSLKAFDDGSGEALYVGGSFNYLGSDSFDEAFTPVSDPDVLFGGTRQIGGVNARSLARWDGRWEIVGGGLISSGINRINFADPRSMIVHDDGTGDALYIGGDIAIRGGVSDGVVRRVDRGWERVGEPLNGVVSTLASDQRPGGLLYAAGSFQVVPFTNEFAEQVMAWDGIDWETLGSEEFDAPIRGLVATSLADAVVHPSSVIAVGDFSSIGSHLVSHIASWDGSSWLDIGGGTNGPVNSAIFDDTGAASPAGSLLVAGEFDMVGGTEALGVAAWDGSKWHSFGSGLSGTVYALAVFDGGLGPELYAGGDLTASQRLHTTEFARNILRWDGQAWQGLRLPGEDISLASVVINQIVRVLEVVGRGEDSALGVGGTSSRVTSGASVVYWDGVAWGKFGNERPHQNMFFRSTTCAVSALAEFDEGDGPAIWVGGQFFNADERSPADIPQRGRSPRGSSSIAKWIQRGIPRITSQPTSAEVGPGSTATFTIEAVDPNNDDQLFYQWLRDEVPLGDDLPIIQGAHTPTLRIFPVRPIDEDEYSCIVSNSCGEVESDEAELEFDNGKDKDDDNHCDGDVDRSGVVNFDDLTTILSRWGAGQSVQGRRIWAVRGDATGDGVVDFDDITRVLSDFGRPCDD